jgi:hypothetical protein
MGETIVQKRCASGTLLKAQVVDDGEEENGGSDSQTQIKQLVRGRYTINRDQQREAARKERRADRMMPPISAYGTDPQFAAMQQDACNGRRSGRSADAAGTAAPDLKATSCCGNPLRIFFFGLCHLSPA